MKREIISCVAAVGVLFVVIGMLSRSGSTQSSISDCKQPSGNPPCKANNEAKFNDGQNTGCRVEFHWLRCDGVSHGQVHDSCTNIGCRDSCSCSCMTNGYGVSWLNTCTDTVKSESFSCNRCGAVKNEMVFWRWLSMTNQSMEVMPTGYLVQVIPFSYLCVCGRTQTTTEFQRQPSCLVYKRWV